MFLERNIYIMGLLTVSWDENPYFDEVSRLAVFGHNFEIHPDGNPVRFSTFYRPNNGARTHRIGYGFETRDLAKKQVLDWLTEQLQELTGAGFNVLPGGASPLPANVKLDAGYALATKFADAMFKHMGDCDPVEVSPFVLNECSGLYFKNVKTGFGVKVLGINGRYQLYSGHPTDLDNLEALGPTYFDDQEMPSYAKTIARYFEPSRRK